MAHLESNKKIWLCIYKTCPFKHDVGVGKSSLLMRLTENEFKEEYEVTVGVEFGAFLLQIEDKIIKLQIWDTAGQESFKSLNKIFYRGMVSNLII